MTEKIISEFKIPPPETPKDLIIQNQVEIGVYYNDYINRAMKSEGMDPLELARKFRAIKKKIMLKIVGEK